MCFLKNILKIFDIFVKMRYYITRDAEVSELADEQDSGSSALAPTISGAFFMGKKKVKKV